MNKRLTLLAAVFAVLLIIPSFAYAAPIVDTPRGSGFIYGYVFNDLNINGVRDVAGRGLEPAISGVTVTVTKVDDGTTVQALTDRWGGYHIGQLASGLYLVSEENLAGYTSTTPDQVQVLLVGNPLMERVDFGDY